MTLRQHSGRGIPVRMETLVAVWVMLEVSPCIYDGEGSPGVSMSAFRFSGKRRLITVVLAAVVLITLIAVVAFNIFHTRTAFGAGNSGGLCSPNAPVCTINGNSAYADFTSVSSDGCITTDVALEPTQ